MPVRLVSWALVTRLRLALAVVIVVALGWVWRPGGASDVAAGDGTSAAPGTVRLMQLVTPTAGVALKDSALRLTTDGGKSWSDITPPGVSPTGIRGLHFASMNDGWVAAGGGEDELGRATLRLFHTDDGGKRWSERRLDVSSTYGQVFLSFADPQHGWVEAVLQSSSNFSVGELFRTSDGGATWTKVSVPVGGPVRFEDPTTGWVTGGPSRDELYLTRDGGDSWERQSVPEPDDAGLTRMVVGLPRRLPGAGASRLLPVTLFDPEGTQRPLVAVYGGEEAAGTWSMRSAAPRPDPPASSVSQAVDAETEWALRRVDRVELSDEPAGVGTVDFPSPDRGWLLAESRDCLAGRTVCGMAGVLHATTDGGRTWKRLEP